MKIIPGQGQRILFVSLAFLSYTVFPKRIRAKQSRKPPLSQNFLNTHTPKWHTLNLEMKQRASISLHCDFFLILIPSWPAFALSLPPWRQCSFCGRSVQTKPASGCGTRTAPKQVAWGGQSHTRALTRRLGEECVRKNVSRNASGRMSQGVRQNECLGKLWAEEAQAHVRAVRR